MGNTLTLKKNGANLVAGRKSLRVNDKNMKGRHLLYVTKTIHLLMIFFWYCLQNMNVWHNGWLIPWKIQEREITSTSGKQSNIHLIHSLCSVLLSLPNNVWRLIVFAPFLIIIIIIILSFFGTWTCPRQISGTTGQNFMKLGGVIDICLVLKFSTWW